VKVSPQLYDRWLDEISARESQKRLSDP